MRALQAAIEAYIPENEQEEADRKLLLALLSSGQNLLTRNNLICHLTASAWITEPKRQEVLMAWHKLYKSWSWLGGHADGEADLLSVALREAKEESGLKQIRALSGDIFSLEILTVDGHEKRGSYVPCHLHLNVTYLLEASREDALQAKEDENTAVRWFPLQEAVEASCEPWFRERIYSKLNRKLQRWTREGKV